VNNTISQVVANELRCAKRVSGDHMKLNMVAKRTFQVRDTMQSMLNSGSQD
jgi:hypothetical protein